MLPDIPVGLLVLVVVALFVYGEFRLRYIARLRAAGLLPKRPPMWLLVFGTPAALKRFDARSRQA